MAIAKKGTRSLVVDGCRYRWKVTRSFQKCLGHWNGAKFAIQVTLSAERFNQPAGKLIATIPGFLERGFEDYQYFAPENLSPVVPDPSDLANTGHLIRLAVSPAQAAEVIRYACALGWNPSEDGPPFVIRDIHHAMAGTVFPVLNEIPPTPVEYERFKNEFWREFQEAFSPESQGNTQHTSPSPNRRIPPVIRIWPTSEECTPGE